MSGEAQRSHRWPPLLLLAALGASCSPIDVVARGQREDGLCSAADAGCDAGVDAGACRAEVCNVVASSSQLCESAGTIVRAGDRCASGERSATSRYALCSCSDLVSNSPITSDAYEGTLASRVADAASIGVNRDVTLSGEGNLDGSLEAVGRRSLGSNVKADAVRSVTSPPCNCSAAQLLDVEAIVARQRSDNDNAAARVSEGALDGFRGAKELSLSCGRYYFTRMKSEDPLTLRARGHVALFVQGNIELNNALTIQTEDDTSQVDLFVAGDMHVLGTLAFGGDPNGRSRVNLYLQSGGTLDIGGSVDIVGDVYAPRAELVTQGAMRLYGSLFVRRAALGGELHLHYDTRAQVAPSCQPL